MCFVLLDKFILRSIKQTYRIFPIIGQNLGSGLRKILIFVSMFQKNTITITPENISSNYVVLFKKEDGFVTSYIPAFDIWYSSPSEEEAKRRSRLMVKSFFRSYLENEGWNAMILGITKLGFKAPKQHDFIVHKLLKKSLKTASFGKVGDSANNYDFETESIEEATAAVA